MANIQPFTGFEVKASAGALAEAAGDKFVHGMVLYLNEQRLSFAGNLWAH